MNSIIPALRGVLTLVCALSLSLSASAQRKGICYTEGDVKVFNDYLSKFKDKRGLPVNELVTQTGLYFKDVPYVNYTLEARDPEELIVNLRELDCVTFVENTVALTLTMKSDSLSFDTFCNNLRRIRYRGGVLKDFSSRLHYFSEWITDNQAMGVLEDVTGDFGGKPYPIKVRIMSQRPTLYRQLVAHPELIPVIASVEDSISKFKKYYIPRDSIGVVGRGFESGYIIGTTTNTSMDISHCGFVCMLNGTPHFMHASSKEKKVVVTDITLQKYLEGVRSMTGVMVARVTIPEAEKNTLFGRNDEMPRENFLTLPK